MLWITGAAIGQANAEVLEHDVERGPVVQREDGLSSAVGDCALAADWRTAMRDARQQRHLGAEPYA